MSNTRPTLTERCLCGHTRADHAATFGPCLICQHSTDERFRCAPGTCDRFTWTPPEEPAEPRAHA